VTCIIARVTLSELGIDAIVHENNSRRRNTALKHLLVKIKDSVLLLLRRERGKSFE